MKSSRQYENLHIQQVPACPARLGCRAGPGHVLSRETGARFPFQCFSTAPNALQRRLATEAVFFLTSFHACARAETRGLSVSLLRNGNTKYHVHQVATLNPSKQKIDTFKTCQRTVFNIVWNTIQVLKKVRKADIAPFVYTLIC